VDIWFFIMGSGEMKRSLCRNGLILGVLALMLNSCGTGGRNCLIIPAQVDLLKERKESALLDLENKARQVDRLSESLVRTKENLADMQAEKALLDSLINAGEMER
jgi:cell division protein FtsB